MLDQVASAGALLANVGQELAGDVELMKTGEDDGLEALFAVPDGDHVATEDLQPGIGLPDLLPEIAGGNPAGIGGICLHPR